MPSDQPDVTVLLIERQGPPGPRMLEAWQECAAAYEGRAALAHVWAGPGEIPTGVDHSSLSAAVADLGLADDALVIVAEASAVPGPHLVRRLVDEALVSPGRVVDTRVLPVEVTRTDDRDRGYYLSDDADPEAQLLEEKRHLDPDAEESETDHDEDHGQPDRTAKAADSQEGAVAAHEVGAQDGWRVRPRVTGVCCAVRAHDLPLVEDALLVEPGAASGTRLVEAATQHGLDVDVATTPAVSLPIRLAWDASIDGWVAPAEGQPVEWDASSHPVDLPASSLGMLARQLGLRADAPADGVERAPSTPFLSIVTRTQGKRLHCLEDMLTCLAGQVDRDFEVLVMAHRVEESDLVAVHDVVASLPQWLRDVVRVVTVERPGRAAPLNDGFEAALGRYVVVLDDDDTVLAHYVSTFKQHAVTHDGRLLRVVTARQDVAPVGDPDALCAVSVDDPFRDWPMDFALFAHLMSNYTPFMSVAFPRGAFHSLGFRFDETLDTTEDWDFLVRCAAVLGVESIREITCVYRWWVHTASSREAHTKAEWDEAASRVKRRFEESVLLLRPDETERLVDTVELARQEVVKANGLARKFATSQHHTNLEMSKVAEAHHEAVAKRDAMAGKVAATRAELKEVRQKLKRRTARLRLLEARLVVEERLREGTLVAPQEPLDSLSLEELQELAKSPATQPRSSVIQRFTRR